MPKRKVVITGAAGYVAGRMLQVLRERYDLVLLDVTTRNRDGQEVAGVQVVDLPDRNRDGYRQYFNGADAAIHCGFVRSERGTLDTNYRSEFTNVDMAYNVYQVCLEEGVRRVVVC